MFKYHGYSGNCPKPPLAKVHEAVGDNIVPQGPTFHWRNGWMFARGEANDVHVWNIDRGIDLIIPSAEWVSIINATCSVPIAEWMKGWPGLFEIKHADEKLSTLQRALVESVKLQSHYAGLLNQYDGGKRLQFANVREWIERINR